MPKESPQARLRRYSVPTEHANSVVSLRIYHDHIAAVADGVRVAAHPRCFDRSQTFYDWQHYISLLERKPGGLRNGAPFETMPAAFKQLLRIPVIVNTDSGRS